MTAPRPHWTTVPCKIHTGAKGANGYGSINENGETELAHRATWKKAYGPIPNGLNVLHYCDVHMCIEKLHLWLGTQKDNLDDMRAKGRAYDNAGKAQIKKKGFGDKQRIAQYTSRMRTCLCGLEVNAGAMACHLKGADQNHYIVAFGSRQS